jgi:hypothetical protein
VAPPPTHDLSGVEGRELRAAEEGGRHSTLSPLGRGKGEGEVLESPTGPAPHPCPLAYGERVIGRRHFIGAAAAIPALLAASRARAADDAVLYAFAAIGCNRINEPDIRPDNPSTANLAQLDRTFAEIAALDPLPELLFFTGDLVFGLARDLTVLEAQLRAWIDVYRRSPVGRSGKIRLVALPGNHESLRLNEEGHEIPNRGAEAVWLRVMSPYIAGDNGPGAGGPDDLDTDQRRLTYSFRHRNTHFVVMNTDPYATIGDVPWTWAMADMARARRDRAVQTIFCLGHKPAFTPADAYPDFSLDGRPRHRDRLWNAMNDARVTAYIVAHSHMYERKRYASLSRPGVRGTWQIVAGNGGSQLETLWIRRAGPGFFGFTVIKVMASGRVFAESWGRDFPAGRYMAPSPPSEFPTTIRDAGEITFHLDRADGH